MYVPGWIDDPVAVQATQATLAVPVFATTEANAADTLPDHAYLWEAYRKTVGKLPPAKNQGSVGSCVSFGTNTAIRRTMAVEIFVGEPEEFRDIAEEITYGGSRIEIGGGRISGDGSVGAWAAKFVEQFGVVARGVYGNVDLGEYSESRCRDYGRRGVPDELEPVAKQHPIKTVTQVRNWEEAKRALASGYGIAICSNQGFEMRRDSRGICDPSGSWAHCMALDGYHVEAGREYGHIVNSWGDNAHTGPVGWGDPGGDGFWAESGVVNRMLGQDDSWAFSALQGFPGRKLNWLI
jgi:hypothetical protein